MKVYGISNCDTMKKAFAWLESRGREKLAHLRGTTWRKIPQKTRVGLTEAKLIALLEANPSAIRRPIVEAGPRLLIGFDAAEFAKAVER